MIDINTTVEDTIRVGPKKRNKNPKERNMIDVKKNDITYFKCGIKEHISKYYNFQRKMNKLDISGKLKDKLMGIMELTDSDETDNDIHQIDNCEITSSSYTSSNNGRVKLCNCNNPDNCYCKRKLKISVLTKQEDIIMDLIDRFPDL